ncbi:MAG: ZIP family metal transporter [Candidatus Woesearchaeota archaeon]|jgi:zinc and cadmium transporter
MGYIIYTFASVIIVSLISVIAAIPFLLKKQIPHSILIILMSLSVGTLLGGVFLHFLPEIAEKGYNTSVALSIIIGFMAFLLLEKMIHWHHAKKVEENCECGHGHGYHFAILNLLGDGVHNFLDGLVIAGSYAVSIPLGIAATTSVIFHEIPQEMADFGILLYGGLSKTRAIIFNFLSATAAIIGAITGIMFTEHIQGFSAMIIPFAAGNFLYIAASNLVPELHKHCKISETIMHIIAIAAGVGFMLLIAVFIPETH